MAVVFTNFNDWTGASNLWTGYQGFWYYTLVGMDARILLYSANRSIDRNTVSMNLYDPVPEAAFSHYSNPAYWSFEEPAPGELRFSGDELVFQPAAPTNVRGWILTSSGSDNVVCGDDLFTPRKKILVGQTLRFTPQFLFSDHGPPCD